MRRKQSKKSSTKVVSSLFKRVKVKVNLKMKERHVDNLPAIPQAMKVPEEDKDGDEGLVLEADQEATIDEAESLEVDREVLVMIMRMVNVTQLILKMSEERLNHEIIFKGNVKRRRERETIMKV